MSHREITDVKVLPFNINIVTMQQGDYWRESIALKYRHRSERRREITDVKVLPFNINIVCERQGDYWRECVAL